MSTNELLEPVHLYETELKDKHHQNVVDAFEELSKKSEVDFEANKATCTSLHKNETLLENVNKSLAKLTGLLYLFVLIIVLGVAGIGYGIYGIIQKADLGILFLILGVLLLALGIVLIIKVFKPKKAEYEKKADEYSKKISNLKEEAGNQMAPLNALFDSSLSAKLFNKTCPLIEMDRVFDVKKYELMREKYDMWDNSDKNSSTLDIQSGSILGNPFVVFKDLQMKMVNHTYVGTMVISYTVGSGDNRRNVTETLRATYQAPEPVYSKETYLVYGNEAANRLSFSRNPSNINSFSKEELQKYVRKHEKDLDKIAAKSMKKGKTFTPIGNPEFELFFGGLDRDNEVEFRLLFTALGQKSMLDLLKSNAGYGDDFSFRKIKGLNIICSKHSQGNALFADTSAFAGYEYESIKEFFITYNDNYFKSLFFDFAPLLSIPLYQQYKTHEYIYKNTVQSNYTPFEHEVLANKFNISELANKLSKTATILKTNFVEKSKETDIVSVTAHSFNTIARVKYVSVYGGDGRFHEVPVHWIEYIPVSQESVIKVNDLGVDDEVKFRSLSTESVIYGKGLISGLGDNLNVDINKIKALMQKD